MKTKSIEFKIDDGDFKEYSEDLNLKDLVENIPGKYIVYVRVSDVAGNENVQKSEFEIEESGDVLGASEEELPETGQAIIAIFTIAVVLLLGFFGYRFFKKKKKFSNTP